METILLPLDLAACPPEIFAAINRFSSSQSYRIILLHVLKLNVVLPGNGLYEEVAQDAIARLTELQREYLHAEPETQLRVRWGRPAQEIVAEAAEAGSDLIILSSRGNRRRRLWQRDLLEEVIAHAPCPVKIVRVTTLIDRGTHFAPTGQPSASRPEFVPGLVPIPCRA